MTRLGQAVRPPCRNPGGVDFDGRLNDVVLFEIPEFEQAMGLCGRLATNWMAWVHRRDEVRFVAALLVPEAEGDLAALLRTVEQWVAERGLVAIRFELDGRAYVLEAGEPIWSGLAA
jgi:hypothetical protein